MAETLCPTGLKDLLYSSSQKIFVDPCSRFIKSLGKDSDLNLLFISHLSAAILLLFRKTLCNFWVLQTVQEIQDIHVIFFFPFFNF